MDIFTGPCAKTTFAEDLGTEIATIYVGPERKHYTIHKKLLTSQSDYFDKALNGRFQEAEENSIHLKEDDPAAVGLLIGWLYRGVIPGTERRPTIFVEANFPASHTPIALPKGGTIIPFIPKMEAEPNTLTNQRNNFQHIGFQSSYEKFSPEELRMADYNEGRRFNDCPPRHPATFGGFPGGSTGLGAQHQQTSAVGGGLFGTLNTQPTSTTGGLFGTAHSQQPFANAGGLFGHSQVTNTTGSLGNVNPQPISTSSGGLFGTAHSQQPFSNVGGLFGQAQHTYTGGSGTGSLFSGLWQSQPYTGGGGLFSTPGSQHISQSTTAASAPSIFSATGTPGMPPTSTASQFAHLASQSSIQSAAVSQTSSQASTPTATSSSATVSQPSAQPQPTTTLSSPYLAPPPSSHSATTAAPSAPIVSNPFGPPSANNSLFGGSLFGGGSHSASSSSSSSPFSSPDQESAKLASSFGQGTTIKYPKAATPAIEGIPPSTPLSEQVQQLEEQDVFQLALLHLSILAENICWPTLYNVAVKAYVQGEINLYRTLPLHHVALIYERTEEKSTLRQFVLDSLGRLDDDEDYTAYMQLAQEYEDLLLDILKKVGKKKNKHIFDAFDGVGLNKYRTHEEAQAKAAYNNVA